jgi:hypothetical protein
MKYKNPYESSVYVGESQDGGDMYVIPSRDHNLSDKVFQTVGCRYSNDESDYESGIPALHEVVEAARNLGWLSCEEYRENKLFNVEPKETHLYFADNPRTLNKLFIERISTDSEIDYLFPEVVNGMPIHPRDIVLKCPEMIGKHVATMSEHVALYMLKVCTDKTLIHFITEDSQGFNSYDIKVDEDGELCRNFPGGFFNERFELLF